MKEINLKNIYAFIQGFLRWFIWINPKLRKRFMRKHITEQIKFRINSTNKKCYNNGSCIHCGCMVPQLQMSNKTCGGHCYPIMYDKETWNSLKEEPFIYMKQEETGISWRLDLKKQLFIRKK